MLYTYEATKLDHRMHQEKPVGNYMYVVSNPLFMHYALSNNILLNRNRHLLKTNILDVRLYTDFCNFQKGCAQRGSFCNIYGTHETQNVLKLHKNFMQTKFCEIKEYSTQFMQKLCKYLPQIEFTSFKISISKAELLQVGIFFLTHLFP